MRHHPLHRRVPRARTWLAACIVLSGVLTSTYATSPASPAQRDDPAPASRAADQPPMYRNPILPDIGPADPSVIRVDNKYYMYPTWDTKGYDVLVSDDLIHWQRKPKCFVDERGGAWAPDVFHHLHGDGKFYLYFTLDNPDGGKLIGVAVSDGALGPFEDPQTLDTNAIDAHLFRDDDGALYLYYVRMDGGFRIVVAADE